MYGLAWVSESVSPPFPDSTSPTASSHRCLLPYSSLLTSFFSSQAPPLVSSPQGSWGEYLNMCHAISHLKTG